MSTDPRQEESSRDEEEPLRKRRRPSPRVPHSVLGWVLYFLATALGAPLQLLMFALIGAAAFVYVTLPALPDVESLRDVQFKEPLRVYSADNALIGEYGIQRRRPVAYRDVPPLIVQAFLATEDSRFFQHSGVDVIGLARATLSYLVTGQKTQGGSTISMQVTRNFFLTPQKTFQRKLMEVLLTLHVEQTLTKQEILDLYLNQIFFGHRAYGISAAAALYYDKSLDDLTLPEAAMLAGIPKAPSTNNPVTNPVHAMDRRNYILGRMRELGYITQAAYDQAVHEPDTASLHRRQPDIDAGYIGEMARLEVLKIYGEDALSNGLRVTTTIRSDLQRQAQKALREALHEYDHRHGYRGAEAHLNLAAMSEKDMDVYLETVPRYPDLLAGLVTQVSASTAEVFVGHHRWIQLDRKAVAWAGRYHNENWRGPQPRRVSDALARGDLVRLIETPDGNWELSQVPVVAGALVSLDPHDGAIRALVGGYSFTDTKFNHVTDMRRQPGSSFKPFIYASALNKGWTPASLVKDEAVQLTGRDRSWNPQNSDRKELGPIRLRRALMLSRNLASINLLQSVGVEDAKEYLRNFGFELQSESLGLSMALGTAELSPLQLAAGYAIFANGGYRVLPYFIQRIEDGNGNLLFAAHPPTACDNCWWHDASADDAAAHTRPLWVVRGAPAQQVIDPRIAYQITSMMRDVIEHGTATRAMQLGRSDIVGKTGTTNDMRDSWFAGFQARFVTIAWMGFDDFSKLGRGEYGGVAALGMWMDFMRDALAEQPVAQLDPPAGLVAIRIDPDRGVETGSSSGIPEMVREEYRLNLLGPRPVHYAGSGDGESVRRSAPRVMDELF